MGVGENMRWQRIWRRWGSDNLGFLIMGGGRPALLHLWLRKEVKRLAMPDRRWRLASWLSPGQGIKSEGDPLCLPVCLGPTNSGSVDGTNLSLGSLREHALALSFPTVNTRAMPDSWAFEACV